MSPTFQQPASSDGVGPEGHGLAGRLDRSPASDPPRQPPGKLLLTIEGMHCAACVSRIESAARDVDGVVRARVNLATRRAVVEFHEPAGAPEILAAIDRAGYSAKPIEPTDFLGRSWDESIRRELRAWRRRLMLAAILLAPLLLLPHHGGSAVRWILLLSATAMQLIVGWPFLVGAARQLVRWSANMDSLVAIGTSTAYVVGLVDFVRGAPSSMSLMDGGMILTFVTLGKFLELSTRRSASGAIGRLLELAPREARIEEDGAVRTVPVLEVLPGAILVIRPGDRVPLDAEVISGAGDMDESWLTGESLPVEKAPGAAILAGSLNGSSALRARVTRTADATALAQVIQLVEQAQESKAGIERLADRAVRYFVPVVLLVAAVTLAGWLVAGRPSEAIRSMVAVLIVACPCAMGLATPTAVMAGTGRGAELGILIKNAQALETAGRLTTIVFDKTGTLTAGQPVVTEFDVVEGTADEFWDLVSSVEQLSSHPLASAIVRFARSRPHRWSDDEVRRPAGEPTEGISRPPDRAGFAALLPILSGPAASAKSEAGATELALHPGEGVSALCRGRRVAIGNERLMARLNVTIDPSLISRFIALQAQGVTTLLVVVDGQYRGHVALADSLAEGSATAVREIQGLGLETVLLTGDKQGVAAVIAGRVGILRFLAELLPAEKQREIQRRQELGERVAMVGDGINDAPALAASDLGIAIGSGADVAIEAADIVLVQRDLRGVSRALSLARATLRTIQWNLAWAFAYNILLIPLAAGALAPWGWSLSPTLASAAMALSSVSVVLNSLRLRWHSRWAPPAMRVPADDRQSESAAGR